MHVVCMSSLYTLAIMFYCMTMLQFYARTSMQLLVGQALTVYIPKIRTDFTTLSLILNYIKHGTS